MELYLRVDKYELFHFCQFSPEQSIAMYSRSGTSHSCPCTIQLSTKKKGT